jgi:hypothetical protein
MRRSRMGSHMDGRFAQTGRRRPDRRALAAAAVSACALALGALAAVHGREAARGFGAFLKAHVLEAPVLKGPRINAERADQRTRG